MKGYDKQKKNNAAKSVVIVQYNRLNHKWYSAFFFWCTTKFTLINGYIIIVLSDIYIDASTYTDIAHSIVRFLPQAFFLFFLSFNNFYMQRKLLQGLVISAATSTKTIYGDGKVVAKWNYCVTSRGMFLSCSCLSFFLSSSISIFLNVSFQMFTQRIRIPNSGKDCTSTNMILACGHRWKSNNSK